jgi:hypothetical protein
MDRSPGALISFSAGVALDYIARRACPKGELLRGGGTAYPRAAAEAFETTGADFARRRKERGR